MKKFIDKMTEFLDHELDDYGIKYDYQIEDDDRATVTITHFKDTAEIEVRYDLENDEIEIEMGEDSFYRIRWFDTSVKYFWMMVAPQLDWR